MRPTILVVGQTPPPFGGQAVMVERLLETSFSGGDLHHVRMQFSASMDDIGRFSIRKCLALPVLILRIISMRVKYRISTLYYTPGGDNPNAILRDTALLLAVRWMFRKTVFHIHAGGFTEVISRLPRCLQFFARRAYRRPDCAISLSTLSPPDAEVIGAKRSVIVANGLPDEMANYEGRIAPPECPEVLFVGLVSESKGILDLLDAMRLVHEQGLHFKLRVLGQFADASTEQICRDFVQKHGFGSQVIFDGICRGRGKWERFSSASVFCFPTHFGAENQSLVIIEAMQACLPVVATRWRAIPSLVADAETGYLVEVGDIALLAEKVAFLLRHPDVGERFGRAGRARYESDFSLATWQQRMEDILMDVSADVSQRRNAR